MANILVVALLLPLSRPLGVEAQVLAPDGSSGNSKLIRKHEEPAAVQLGATGDLLVEKVSEKTEKRSGSGVKRVEYCKDAYVQGNVGTNTCQDSTLHKLIDAPGGCEDAALQAGADKGDATREFLLGDNWELEYPKGCYKDATATTPPVFFYNAALGMPDNPETHGATPICVRKRWQNATAAGVCPSTNGNYARILDSPTCMTFATCNGYCHSLDNLFVVGESVSAESVSDARPAWASLYNKMPKGCFIRTIDHNGVALSEKNAAGEPQRCVYFNEPQNADPTDPKGIPVCNIAGYE